MFTSMAWILYNLPNILRISVQFFKGDLDEGDYFYGMGRN